MPALKLPKNRVKRFSSLAPKHHVTTFEQRIAQKKELEMIKDMEKEKIEEAKEKRRIAAERRRAKAEYKKEQQLVHALKQHQGVQLIKDPKKIRKMDQKVRKTIVKMPPELLQRYLKK